MTDGAIEAMVARYQANPAGVSNAQLVTDLRRIRELRGNYEWLRDCIEREFLRREKAEREGSPELHGV